MLTNENPEPSYTTYGSQLLQVAIYLAIILGIWYACNGVI